MKAPKPFAQNHPLRYVLTSMLVILALSLYAQPAFNVTSYTNSNGLPQNQVKCMAFDNQGYLWLGTYGGLCRFDGQNFITFDLKNTAVLRSNRITIIFKAADGLIHFYDDLKNPYLIDNHENIQFDTTIAHKRNIICGNEGFFFYEKLMDHPDIPNSLAKGTHGILTFTKKINEYECYAGIDGNIYYLNTLDKIIKKLEPLPDYYNWWSFAVNDIFVFYNRDQLTLYKKGLPISNEGITPLALKLVKQGARDAHTIHIEDKSFIISDGQLYQFVLRDGIIDAQVLTKLEDIEPSELEAVKKDSGSGKLFVSTFTKGLLMLRPSSINTFLMEKDNTFGYSVADIISLGRGDFLTHTHKFNIYTRNVSPLPVLVTPWSLYKSSNGTIYFVGGFRSDKLEHGRTFSAESNFTNAQPFKGLQANNGFTTLLEDSAHIVWIGSHKTLCQLRPDRTIKEVIYIGNEILKIFNYDTNHLWLLTEKGMFEYAIKQNQLASTPLFPYLQIRNIFKASDKSIWLGTYGNGFFTYVQKKLIPLPLAPSGALKNAHNFYEDRNGFFWIPTNNGLIQCLKADLDAYVKDNRLEPYYYLYTTEDGLLSNEFNGGANSPYAIDEKGNLVYPSLNGIVFFSPEKMRPVTLSGKINIESAMVDEKPVSVSKKLVIPAGFSRININVGISFFGSKDNLVIEYNIDGLDQNWYKVPGSTQITLNRLPSGDYNLTFRKRNGFGVQNYEYKKVSFTVLPYFYETLWFKILGVLGIVAAVALFFFMKNRSIIEGKKVLERQVQQRTLELDRIVQQLNVTMEELYTSEQKLFDANKIKDKAISIILHDIKAPVRYLGIAATSLHNSIYNLSRSEMEALTASFSDSAQTINSFVEELLQWLIAQRDEFSATYSTFSIKELVNELYNLYQGVAMASNNIIEVANISDTITLTTDRNILKLIIRNLIDNALKHTTGGVLSLSTTQSNNATTRIIIEDNGAGIPESELEKIRNDIADPNLSAGESKLGYGLVKSFLKIINGKLTIESTIGKGTKVTLLLKAPSTKYHVAAPLVDMDA